MLSNVYQHFRKDEHPFIDSITGWFEQVDNQYAPYVTDFLNPREAYILETLIGKKSDITYKTYGGFETAERKCAIIYPSYFEPSQEDFDVALYEIKYPLKFGSLTHGKILGTLMSTGIKREFIGDIITDGTRWQVFIKESMANYVVSQVDKIGSFGVRFERLAYTDVLTPIDEWVLESLTISSLRIDNIISSVYNVSRQRAKQVVEAKRVKVNWVENERVDYLADYLDIISVRGLGRIQIMEQQGKTKKDKVRLNIRVLRK
ncbi:RNA-binding protein [Vagococcus sp. DIV0080]|uniref:RNA-binding protein n=1 Tax=Candidatus Vagococcus giribetii TaxID=2230876 RepID=A0ABS3HQD6_9ENTE|nr:YlmH/Sll1252 family protein [Vagococcus sp. DIV0080]MBO0475962.1 RNA-binding protein [Vagococcus sp. DIV0080]